MSRTLTVVSDELLREAEGHLFGAEPGPIAARLYEALSRADDERDRAQLAAALARVWAYGGHADRAVGPATEAVLHAERAGDPALLADCLDAALAAHWGPDALGDRLRLVRRLDEAAAHVVDPGARLKAHLWMLQVATETLNVHEILRQLRALDRLGEELPKARFFAVSRRLMYDELRGRFDTAPALISAADAALASSGLADAWMVVAALRGYTAWFTGDQATCSEMAQVAEDLAIEEGIPVLHAEAATLWLGARREDRVAQMLSTFRGGRLRTLVPDHDWLLTLQLVLEAALALDDGELIAEAAELLGPYEGRAVVNAGAVMFHGVTDDPLSRAAAWAGDSARALRLRDAARATYIRLGASWWLDRLEATRLSLTTTAFHLRPAGGAVHDVWFIGRRAAPMRALRGLRYLRRLVRQPGRPIGAIDLTSDGTETVEQSPLDTLDAHAIAEYRQRLVDLDDEISEASEWSDFGRLDGLQAERDALVNELTAAVGLGGRRRTTGSTVERARVAANKAINTALARVATVDHEMAEHLRNSLHLGYECMYDPRSTTEWVTT